MCLRRTKGKFFGLHYHGNTQYEGNTGFVKNIAYKQFKLKRPVEGKTATVKILVRMADAFAGG
jgi:hypothetical protein